MAVNGQYLDMVPISCMNWNNTTNAGVWSVNLNNTRSNSNNNVGFRCDSLSSCRAGLRVVEIQGDSVRHAVRAKSPAFPFLVGSCRTSGVAQ
jgi:hypothetical protein